MSHCSDLLSIHDFIFDKIMPTLASYDRKELLSKYFDGSYYLHSYYENLIEFFKEIEDKISYSIKSEFKSKINLCYYNIGMDYYQDENYSDALDRFNDCINNYYISSDYRKKSRERISICYYFLAKEQIDYCDLDKAKEYLLNSIDYFSDSSNMCNYRSKITNLLAETYKGLGYKKWNINNQYDMEDSIKYYNQAKSKSSGNLYNDITNILKNLNEYYYLYKAYNNYGISRKDFLYDSYRNFGRYSSEIKNLYEKQVNILRIEDDISNINSRKNRLQAEVYNIQNNVSSQKSYNNQKIKLNKTIRENVNGFIDKINKLTNNMNENVVQATEKSSDVIQTQKDTKAKIDDNVEKQEKLLKELEEIEKEKENNIKEKRDANRKLKEQNKQYMNILKSFEEKLNIRLNGK